MVMVGDSCPEGRAFKSLHCILDGHFHIPIIVVKKINVCLKWTKIKTKKMPGMAHLKIKNYQTFLYARSVHGRLPRSLANLFAAFIDRKDKEQCGQGIVFGVRQQFRPRHDVKLEGHQLHVVCLKQVFVIHFYYCQHQQAFQSNFAIEKRNWSFFCPWK